VRSVTVAATVPGPVGSSVVTRTRSGLTISVALPPTSMRTSPQADGSVVPSTSTSNAEAPSPVGAAAPTTRQGHRLACPMNPATNTLAGRA
jgi:hypothetical protein